MSSLHALVDGWWNLPVRKQQVQVARIQQALKKGEDPNLPNTEGFTPLGLLFSQEPITRPFPRDPNEPQTEVRPLICALIEAGANPLAYDRPLVLAHWESFRIVLETLVVLEPSVKVADEAGGNAFHVIAQYRPHMFAQISQFPKGAEFWWAGGRRALDDALPLHLLLGPESHVFRRLSRWNDEGRTLSGISGVREICYSISRIFQVNEQISLAATTRDGVCVADLLARLIDLGFMDAAAGALPASLLASIAQHALERSTATAPMGSHKARL